jgi:hypothetical protein
MKHNLELAAMMFLCVTIVIAVWYSPAAQQQRETFPETRDHRVLLVAPPIVYRSRKQAASYTENRIRPPDKRVWFPNLLTAKDLFGENQEIIDSDVVNDRFSTANTAVPAEFAGFLAVERFINNLGRNRKRVRLTGLPAYRADRGYRLIGLLTSWAT